MRRTSSGGGGGLSRASEARPGVSRTPPTAWRSGMPPCACCMSACCATVCCTCRHGCGLPVSVCGGRSARPTRHVGGSIACTLLRGLCLCVRLSCVVLVNIIFSKAVKQILHALDQRDSTVYSIPDSPDNANITTQRRGRSPRSVVGDVFHDGGVVRVALSCDTTASPRA